VERGILVLVDHANDAQLGPLVRALCAEHPDLLVLTEAAQIEEAPHGAVIVLATRVEDAAWLNIARPIFAERALRMVLWSKGEVTADFARLAPDFFDWIARRFECPSGPPAFAVAGLRAALRAKAWAIDWRGRALEEAFAAAFPKHTLVRASAELPDEGLIETARGAGQAWIAWSNVVDEQGLRRLRQALARAPRHGGDILDNPRVSTSEAWPVHDGTMTLANAARALEAGVSPAGRLAALLDLEPEAIGLAAEELKKGLAAELIEKLMLRAADPGAAMGKLVSDQGSVDPVFVTAYRIPAPMLRALVTGPRSHAHPALPPLTEKIERGPVGGREFERLMVQLLKVHFGFRRFLVKTSTAEGLEVNAIAPDGLPGMRGSVAFSFQWPDKDPSRGSSIMTFARRDETFDHLVVISPDLATAEKGRLRRFRRRGKIKVDSWGPFDIEKLLRECPSLLARYYPEEARAYLPGYDGTDFNTLAARYRDKVILLHNRLKTIGFPPEARPRESRIETLLDKLFIPLRLVPEQPNASPMDLARVLESGGSAVVLADPGMGKSTLLAYLALVFAGGAPLKGFTCPKSLVPFHISLRDFVRHQKQSPGLSFLEYLEIEARERLSLPEMHRSFFDATLRMGEAVVLLDGLDEVGNETERHAVTASIRAFQADYADCRFWITSRIYGYTGNVRLPGSFTHYRIDRLDDVQIDNFVGRWYELQIPTSAQEAREQAESLRAAVRRTPSVRRLAGNPLLLTLMAFMHHGLRRLPRDRGELYEKCIEMLLKTWQDAKRGDGQAARGIEGLNVPTQKDYLAHLAFFIQQKNQGGKDEEARGLVSRREAVDALSLRHLTRARREHPNMTEFEARDEMEHFLDYVCDETGLVLDRGNEQASFIHLSFQEYLAAWVFLCDDEMPHGPGFFEEHLGDPAWEEVLLLRLYIILREGGGVKRFDEILASVLHSLERGSAPESWLTLVRAIRDDLEFTDRDRKEILGRAISFWLEAPTFGGTWFNALEEVKLFAELAREMLRSTIAELRAHAQRPADAIALLHLEAKLFAFPDDAAEVLWRRADLGELLADLVPFAEEPAIRSLLAEKATITDWSRALRALDGPEMYRTTVHWMTAAPTPVTADAATALLWEKIVTDLCSRAAFAAPRRGHADAVLFDQPGAVTYSAAFSSATLPYACMRALPVSLPAAIAAPEASLLCIRLARARQDEVATADPWSEFAAWTASVIASKLAVFPATLPLDRETVSGLASLFVRSFGQTLVRVSVRDFVPNFIPNFFGRFFGNFSRDFVRFFGRDFDFARTFGRDFARTFGRLFSREFVRSFGRDFGREFGRSFGRDFGRVFGHEFGHDFVRSFSRDFGVNPTRPDWDEAWDRAMENEANQIHLLGHEAFWDWALVYLGRGKIDPKKKSIALDPELENPLVLPLLLANIWRAASYHTLLASFRNGASAYPGENLPDNALETWLMRNPIDVYGTALAWQEYNKSSNKVEEPAGALILAHAAYASLMTGLECELPFAPNLADPCVFFSYLLYELCNFRDAESNLRKLEQAIASPASELRPLLEAAGIVATGSVDKLSPMPARTEPSSPETEHTLFSWLHLSDIHFGHKDISHRWDQKLVLDALLRDIADRKNHAIPAPGAILITGDIAYAGLAPEYAEARSWLDKLAAPLGIPANCIFLIPGNHDVDRTADGQSRNLAHLVRGLREGDDSLDEILESPEDRALLTSRLSAYLSFASAYSSIQTPDPLYWSHAFVTPSGLPVRLIGLSTPLLAAGDVDREKLRLGNAALAATLTGADKSRELVLVLTHHPLRGGWLADQRDADRWLQSRAHVHLFGHVHEPDSEDSRSGSGSGLIRIAAGAAHGDLLPPGIPASHGYSIGAVIAAADGTLRLRIWPRRWSDPNKDFRVDVNSVPEGRPYAEHVLTGLRLPAQRDGKGPA
jgi:predicted MPP superfamily phosphohydrolase